MSSQGRRQNPPPVRCSATARRTGERCERWAVPGRLHCKLHGAHAGRAGKAAAMERAGATLTLAEMMASNPGRPVWEVILDSIRTVDVLAQAAAQDVAAGKVTTAEGIERVAGLARSAHAMAASAVATKALDMAANAAERWSDVMADRLIVLVADWLGLPVAGHAVTAAIRATLGEMDLSGGQVRPSAPDGPPLMDQVGHALAAALAPRLGLAAGDLAAWFSRVMDAVADGRPVPDLPGAPIAALPAAPEPEPAAEPEPLAAEAADLTLHGQADEQEAEPEVVDAELVEPEPEPTRGRRRVTTTLGYRPAAPTLPSSYVTF
jgi:hypothetical protein